MVYPVSHIDGRTRLKFSNLYEKEAFIKNMQSVPGLLEVDSSGNSLTALVKYETPSPFAYVIDKIISKEPEPMATRDDISSFIAPLIADPAAKAFWLMTVLGPKVGFLEWGISSMIVNRFIKAQFR
ncbi:MAG: hypothetical protein ACT4NX_04385 [Deltaproteobacteria bacterium]